MEQITDWTEEKKTEFANRWADPEDKHLPELCADFGLSEEMATEHFGAGAQRKYPRKLSPEQWKELKKRWYDRLGGTTHAIAKDFDVSLSSLRDHLPNIKVARAGKTTLDNTPERKQEFVDRWADPEDKHLPELCAEFGLTQRAAVRQFGSGAPRKYPRKLSPEQWKELKKRWYDRLGGTAEEIVSEFDLTVGAMRRHLPLITKARQGRGTALLGSQLPEDLLAQLQNIVESGEFTTYKALAAPYDGVSPSVLKSIFGKLSDLKHRVVGPNCPPSMSKSQYDTAKRLWHDPDGGTAYEVADKVGVSLYILRSAFGEMYQARGQRTRPFSQKSFQAAVDAWYSDPLQSIKALARLYSIPYRSLVNALPARDPRYYVLNPSVFDAVCDWFEDPRQTIDACAKKSGASSILLRSILPDKEERNRYKAQIFDLKSLSNCLGRYPKSLSEEQWENLKNRWYDPFGGSAKEIASDFNLCRNAICYYLPPIREARYGNAL